MYWLPWMRGSVTPHACAIICSAVRVSMPPWTWPNEAGEQPSVERMLSCASRSHSQRGRRCPRRLKGAARARDGPADGGRADLAKEGCGAREGCARLLVGWLGWLGFDEEWYE